MNKPIFSCVLILSSFLAPAMGKAAYVSWGANILEIDPISHSQTAAQFYSYNNPLATSYNPDPSLPLLAPQSGAFISFLYQGPDGLSMFAVFDQPNDGSGGTATLNLTSTGLAGSVMSMLVKDDPGDAPNNWNDASGEANLSFLWWPCCTDGFVLGHIDPAIDSWSLTTSFAQLSGIDRYLIFYSNNGSIDSLQISPADYRSFTYSVSQVPVPAAAWLFATALLGLLKIRRVSVV